MDMMTPEERKNLPKKRVNLDEVNTFYLFAASPFPARRM